MPRQAWLPDDGLWSSDWDRVRGFLAEMGPEFAHEVAIVDSIQASGVSEQLAYKTSMHDLWIACRPIGPGPTEFIHVQAPNSVPGAQPGHVVIEHRTLSGKDDQIERAISDAVPLFWRFCAEKFGLVASRPDAAQ